MTTRYRPIYPAAIQLEARRRGALEELARRRVAETSRAPRPPRLRRLRGLFADAAD